MKQWQPHYIKKLTVVGTIPLFITTSKRISHNFTCYKDSIAPHHFPGGGGFSIYNFTLRSLYQNHSVLENWWTTSNDNMPLIRFLGVKLYLYRNAHADYMFLYNNSYPMNATSLTYTSTHPQAMLLHKHTKKIICKDHNRNKKPYKKLKIRPPSQMQNKWYFQHDLADIPLLQTYCTAASFDRMFLKSNGISNTIGFTTLDTLGFPNHNYIKTTTSGYIAQPNTLLFGTILGHLKIESIKFSELIFLGNPEDLTTGISIKNTPPTGTGITENEKKIKNHQLNWKYWGNPFDPTFRTHGTILTTNYTWQQLIDKYKNNIDQTLESTIFTYKTHFLRECRYNPFADKGIGNKLYLIDIKDMAHSTDWDTPSKDTLYTDLPLWLMTWGYIDYHKKCGEHTSIDTTHLLVFKCSYLQPKDINYIVPLDEDFLNGISPYQDPDNIFPNDQLAWHPKLRYQAQTVNQIASTGPGTIKLPDNISAEAHLKYMFYFKIGGQPPPMATLTDPLQQPKYITPDNILQTNSLQNPATPLEYMLWNFDERRGQLTKKATKRITTDKETEQTLFPITETAYSVPTTSKTETQTSDSSDTEKEEMSLEEQLHHQRKQQKLLRNRIKQLLQRLTVLE